MSDSNRLTAAHLDEATIDGLINAPLDHLATVHAELVRDRQTTEARAAKPHGVLMKITKITNASPPGVTHVKADGIDLTVTVPRRVQRDSGQLDILLDTIDPETADHIAEYSVRINEKTHAALAPSVRKKLEPARTVETGKPTVRSAALEAA